MYSLNGIRFIVSNFLLPNTTANGRLGLFMGYDIEAIL